MNININSHIRIEQKSIKNFIVIGNVSCSNGPVNCLSWLGSSVPNTLSRNLCLTRPNIAFRKKNHSSGSGISRREKDNNHGHIVSRIL